MLARRTALFFSHLGFLAPTPRSYNYWDRESTKAFSSLYVKVTHVTSIYIMFAKTRLSTVAKVWQAAKHSPAPRVPWGEAETSGNIISYPPPRKKRATDLA